ncbi:ribosomal-protein-alanine N-acetyltransferase [Amorphus suaedae]
MGFFTHGAAGSFGPVLRGERVYLRPPTASDYPAWARLRSESREFLRPWEPTWPADDLTRIAFRRRLRRYQRDMREDDGYAFFLFDSSDDAIVGGLTLAHIRRGVTQSCSLGYWTGQRFAGKGFMTAGVRLAIGFVFDTLHLHRLEAACLPSNGPSIRLLEKVGFQREGYARSYLCINGAWQDHLLFALVRGDLGGDRGAKGIRLVAAS